MKRATQPGSPRIIEYHCDPSPTTTFRPTALLIAVRIIQCYSVSVNSSEDQSCITRIEIKLRSEVNLTRKRCRQNAEFCHF